MSRLVTVGVEGTGAVFAVGHAGGTGVIAPIVEEARVTEDTYLVTSWGANCYI